MPSSVGANLDVCHQSAQFLPKMLLSQFAKFPLPLIFDHLNSDQILHFPSSIYYSCVISRIVFNRSRKNFFSLDNFVIFHSLTTAPVNAINLFLLHSYLSLQYALLQSSITIVPSQIISLTVSSKYNEIFFFLERPNMCPYKYFF